MSDSSYLQNGDATLEMADWHLDNHTDQSYLSPHLVIDTWLIGIQEPG